MQQIFSETLTRHFNVSTLSPDMSGIFTIQPQVRKSGESCGESKKKGKKDHKKRNFYKLFVCRSYDHEIFCVFVLNLTELTHFVVSEHFEVNYGHVNKTQKKKQCIFPPQQIYLLLIRHTDNTMLSYLRPILMPFM